MGDDPVLISILDNVVRLRLEVAQLTRSVEIMKKENQQETKSLREEIRLLKDSPRLTSSDTIVPKLGDFTPDSSFGDGTELTIELEYDDEYNLDTDSDVPSSSRSAFQRTGAHSPVVQRKKRINRLFGKRK